MGVSAGRRKGAVGSVLNGTGEGFEGEGVETFLRGGVDTAALGGVALEVGEVAEVGVRRFGRVDGEKTFLAGGKAGGRVAEWEISGESL
jgi:hypothetical protein